MKRLLISLIIAFSLLVSPLPAQVTLQSVEKLTITLIDDMLGTTTQNHCSTFSINQKIGYGYWLTTAHCKGDGYTIGEYKDIREIRIDEKADLLLLSGPAAPALKWETRSPKIGDDVSLQGYLEGRDRIFTFYGKVVFPILENVEGSYWPANMVLDLQSGGGMSGGPVFSKRGRVLSVHQGGWYMTGGVRLSQEAPHEAVKEFTEGLWDR